MRESLPGFRKNRWRNASPVR
jgi:4-diphosphocytidyl-2-C-methyl-D-erythritol kinase (EC 2.7.1.148)